MFPGQISGGVGDAEKPVVKYFGLDSDRFIPSWTTENSIG